MVTEAEIAEFHLPAVTKENEMFQVDLTCKGLHAYRNTFASLVEARETADFFACHRGTLIQVSKDGAVVYQREG